MIDILATEQLQIIDVAGDPADFVLGCLAGQSNSLQYIRDVVDPPLLDIHNFRGLLHVHLAARRGRQHIHKLDRQLPQRVLIPLLLANVLVLLVKRATLLKLLRLFPTGSTAPTISCRSVCASGGSLIIHLFLFLLFRSALG